jgi:uncharacterized protein
MCRRAFLVAAALALLACGTVEPTAHPFPDLEVRTVTVDGEPLRVAVAADPAARSRGLSGVAGLGSLDGMLFEYDDAVDPGAHPFWMRDVQFPLEIGFFDAEGRLVDRVRLDPCAPEEPCPRHAASAPFRWVLETPPDRLDLRRDSRLAPHATSFVSSPNR